MPPVSIKHIARNLRKNQTPAEERFWNKVRNKRFNNLKFYRQHIIKYKIEFNMFNFFIADFYCHYKKLIIEIDGDIHKHTIEKDKWRSEILEGMGYKVLRFTNNEVLYNWIKVNAELIEVLLN